MYIDNPTKVKALVFCVDLHGLWYLVHDRVCCSDIHLVKSPISH